MNLFEYGCFSVIAISTGISVIKVIDHYLKYKAGQTVNISVLDIIIMAAGLPGTIISGFFVLVIQCGSAIKLKVFAIRK